MTCCFCSVFLSLESCSPRGPVHNGQLLEKTNPSSRLLHFASSFWKLNRLVGWNNLALRAHKWLSKGLQGVFPSQKCQSSLFSEFHLNITYNSAMLLLCSSRWELLWCKYMLLCMRGVSSLLQPASAWTLAIHQTRAVTEFLLCNMACWHQRARERQAIDLRTPVCGCLKNLILEKSEIEVNHSSIWRLFIGSRLYARHWVYKQW